MRLTREFMLGRAAARDPAFDGVFLTCVRTTGIYCLPSCRARAPRPENVEHARSPDEARARGFRPCLRCRPDDRWAGRDRDRDGLLRALDAVRARPGDFEDVASFAAAAGVGATKLLQLCREHLHRAPAAALLDARLEAARHGLASSRRTVLAIALDSGFAGSSAFHENFRARFGTTPRGYRALLAADAFALTLPEGHPVGRCFAYQLRDPESLSERGDDRSLHLAARLDGRAAALSLQARAGARPTVRVRVSMVDGRAPGAAAMRAAHRLVTRVLRLDLDPRPGERALARDPRLRPLLRAARGLRPWGTPTAFDCLLFAILGQQVHLGFAHALRRGLTARCGERAGDLQAPPDAAAVAALDRADLLRLRSSGAKADAVLTAARAVATGALDLDALARGAAATAREQLVALRGIGPWTAHYTMLRGLGFADSLPVGDVVLAAEAQRVWELPERPDTAALAARSAPFAPHRGLLAFHLWRSAAARPAGAGAATRRRGGRARGGGYRDPSWQPTSVAQDPIAMGRT
ncbi:MAG: Ada metal-binding domain-containing protein [Planctomycetota bacterium]